MLVAATNWAGNLPNWILIVVALFAAYRISKGGGGNAVTELSKSNEVLKEALDEERDKGIQLLARITTLEQKTDVSFVLEPFVKWATEHEQADQERHETTVAAFGAVAAQLQQFDTLADERAKTLAAVTAKTSKAQLSVLAKIADKLDKAA